MAQSSPTRRRALMIIIRLSSSVPNCPELLFTAPCFTRGRHSMSVYFLAEIRGWHSMLSMQHFQEELPLAFSGVPTGKGAQLQKFGINPAGNLVVLFLRIQGYIFLICVNIAHTHIPRQPRSLLFPAQARQIEVSFWSITDKSSTST